MRILVTGAAGFVGATLIRTWSERGAHHRLVAIDNFSRPGSELNRSALRAHGVDVMHADIRNASDLEGLPDVDWVVDAAANPSVLAGSDGRTSSRQLIEHNLVGTINTLEFCKARHAGLIMLSTSRVYSLRALSALSVAVRQGAFRLDEHAAVPHVSARGVTESFPTEAPRSLYGTTKAASEDLALEYADAFGLRIFINRCGVLAGAGQFARPDQGIFAYWIHSWHARRPLSYIGFDGQGHQVRDCLHPSDLVPLIDRQMSHDLAIDDAIVNVSGGDASACSLRQLSDWCSDRFGAHEVTARPQPRRFDVPWLVLDSSAALRRWQWSPARSRTAILEEIAAFAEKNPEWLAHTMR